MLLLFILSQFSHVHGQATCNQVIGQYSLCQCEMSDGSGIIDLSPYGNQAGQAEFSLSGETDGVDYEYVVNLCFPLNAETCDALQQAAGCQRRVSDNSEWSLGGYADAEFNIDGQDLSLHYDTGEDGRKLIIHLECDRNVPKDSPDFKFDGEIESFEYEFTLKSICACPSPTGICGEGGGGKDSEGNSDPGVVGIVLLCLTLVSFVGYFIVGAAFLRVRHNKSGTDLIINKAFWKDFPFLIKDGFVFTFSPVYSVIRGQGYKSMPS